MFTENMAGIDWLAFLLTADPTKAEECLVGGLGDCLEGSSVFRDGAQSWARRTIIHNAIRMLAPRKNHSAVAEAPSDPVSCSFGRTPEAGYAIGSMLRLEAFERFVFVMSVLAPFSGGCALQDIGETRMRALLHAAESAGQCPQIRAGFDSKDHEETSGARNADGATVFGAYEDERRSLSSRTGNRV